MRVFPAILLCSALAVPAHATVLDGNWTESTFSVNVNMPGDVTNKQHTGLAWAPDGSDRLFVLEKTGRVRLLKGALAGTPVWSTFATMSPIITSSECGLIGMAFDPNFAVNRYVYFFVSGSTSEQYIVRYDASGDVGTDRTVIVPGLPTVGANHDGGALGFGPDGKLYWAIGDLGNFTGVNNDLASLAAKVGRANRDGSEPGDNPFEDGPGGNNDYIWARGFRNPFTMTFQPATGQLWLNVVGTNFEQVFVVGAGAHAGYNTYENDQIAGFLEPKIAYRTGGGGGRTITAAVRSGNVATFTTSVAHGFRLGTNLTIAGVADNSFNLADQYVASVPTPTSFTVAQAGPNASSSGGTATGLNQGRCLTGGAFYDASGPAAYRGDFFYGDCVSNRLMRAHIDPATNEVLSIDYWGTNIASQVDIALGPDGALYYTGTGTQNIFRAAPNFAAQALVVGNRNLRADENGRVVTSVRLAQAPGADVQVTVTRSFGDDDVSVAAGAALTFTAANWMRPQYVTIAARRDEDSTQDVATLQFASAGLASEAVAVTVLDLGTIPPSLFADGFEGN